MYSLENFTEESEITHSQTYLTSTSLEEQSFSKRLVHVVAVLVPKNCKALKPASSGPIYRSEPPTVPPQAHSKPVTVPPQARSRPLTVPPQARSKPLTVPPQARSKPLTVPPQAHSVPLTAKPFPQRNNEHNHDSLSLKDVDYKHGSLSQKGDGHKHDTFSHNDSHKHGNLSQKDNGRSHSHNDPPQKDADSPFNVSENITSSPVLPVAELKWDPITNWATALTIICEVGIPIAAANNSRHIVMRNMHIM